VIAKQESVDGIKNPSHIGDLFGCNKNMKFHQSAAAADMIEPMLMKRRKHVSVVRSPPEHIA
jgi:hypothetical protein